ncbi:MAG: hypothetical protein DWB42_17730, partial [Chloroflexi bacterium]|nr:hypothetical protein [Chloroflexota bacterium]
MMPSHRWARNLTITDQDVEFLTNLLLEKEVPLKTETLARALIEERLRQEAALLQERFKDTQLYNPSHSYQVGQKLVFPAFNYETGVVTGIRPGNNPDYGAFSVIAVRFDDNRFNNAGKPREFAAELTTPHKLSQDNGNGTAFTTGFDTLSAGEILEANRDEILRKVEEALSASPDLVYLAQKWFPYDLLLEANLGHRNLAEAVLDMAGGGPLTTEAILQEIGGLGKAPQELQVYSLNYALNDDDRFDEVGPTGEVLWYLSRLEPPEVRQMPAALRYTPIDYDRSLLAPDMLTLEAEIGDDASLVLRDYTPQTRHVVVEKRSVWPYLNRLFHCARYGVGKLNAGAAPRLVHSDLVEVYHVPRNVAPLEVQASVSALVSEVVEV